LPLFRIQDTSLFFNISGDFQKKEIGKNARKNFLQENTKFETEMKKPAEDESAAGENGLITVPAPVCSAGPR